MINPIDTYYKARLYCFKNDTSLINVDGKEVEIMCKIPSIKCGFPITFLSARSDNSPIWEQLSNTLSSIECTKLSYEHNEVLSKAVKYVIPEDREAPGFMVKSAENLDGVEIYLLNAHILFLYAPKDKLIAYEKHYMKDIIEFLSQPVLYVDELEVKEDDYL